MLGLICMVMNILLFTLALVLTKQVYRLNPRLTTFEIFTAGTFVQALCNEAYMRYTQRALVRHDFSGHIKSLTRKQLRLLLIRLAIGYPAWLMLNYSVSEISLGLAQTIQNLIPFMVLVISYFALKETLHVLEIVNMCISFSAVLFIINYSSKQDGVINGRETNVLLGVCANAACAVMFACVNVVVRSLKEVHHSIVAAFQSTANFVLSVIVLLIYRLYINPNNFDYQFTPMVVSLLFL